jgi:hypothetical protein
MSKGRDKRIYRKGALDSAQIHSVRGINYLAFGCRGKIKHISNLNHLKDM